MLPHSVVIYYNTDASRFEIRNKYLSELLYNFTLPADRTPYYIAVDAERQLIWILSSENYIYRVKINLTGEVYSHDVEAEIYHGHLYTNYPSKRIDILERTGDAFFILGTNQIVVVKVLVDGTGFDASITLERPEYWSSTTYQKAICINQYTENIVMVMDYTAANTTVNVTYKYPLAYSTNIRLDSYERIMDLYKFLYASGITSSPDMVNYRKASAMNWDYNLEYNPVTHLIATHDWFRDGWLHFFKLATDPAYGNMYCGPNYLSNSALSIGRRSGRYYSCNDGYYMMRDANLDIVYEHTWHDFSTNYWAFHPYTEEFYRYNNTTKIMWIYDRFGRILTSSDVLQTYPNYFKVLAGTEDVVSSPVSTNVIVRPNTSFRVFDTTPTIIFRVGVSLTNVHQQFRIAIDRDPDKIFKGGVDDSYDRVADSWVNGANYKDWTWKYSDDWEEVNGTFSSGTWNSLGTGDPGVAGVEPINGVKSLVPKSRYIRFTVAYDDKLDDSFNDSRWFFKIFSIIS